MRHFHLRHFVMQHFKSRTLYGGETVVVNDGGTVYGVFTLTASVRGSLTITSSVFGSPM